MKKKKLASLTAVGALAVVVLLSGTYAWQSISQKVRNEVKETQNPGARLHDDFNFNADGNKDVYVENFADSTNQGVPVYARIRLDEYLEIGTMAGKPTGTPGKDVDIIKNDGTSPVLETDSTWTTYKWEREKVIEEDGTEPLIFNETSAFRKYFLWNQGTEGKPYYMPTFNMNKDNVTADINGTMLGADGTGENPYSDYTVYQSGKTKTDIAIYDADDDTADEAGNVDMDAIIDEMTTASGTNGRAWDTSKLQDTGSQWKTSISVDGVTYAIEVEEDNSGGVAAVEVDLDNTTEAGMDVRLVQETHTAKAVTTGAKIISMEKWIDEGSKAGNYWVYDTDGWVYWANKINAGETTGLLLDKIEIRNDASIEDGYYYAINVVAQFCTKSEDGTWSDFAVEGGAPSAAAKALLNKVSGGAYESYTVSLKNPDGTTATDPLNPVTVAQEGTVRLTAESQARTVSKNFTWKVSNSDGETPVDKGTTFTNKAGAQATLQVGVGEKVGTILKVEVTYAADDGGYGIGTFYVKVGEGKKVADLRQTITDAAENVVVGDFDSYTTVSIDGQKFYIVAKDEKENKALLYAVSAIDYTGAGTYEWADASGTTNVWRDSKIRQYLNSTGDYKNGDGFKDMFPYCDALAEATTIKTREQVNLKTFLETTDKVFLLSEADVIDEFHGEWDPSANGVKPDTVGTLLDDYTVTKMEEGVEKGVCLFNSYTARKDNVMTELVSWLRSPRYSNLYHAGINKEGYIINVHHTRTSAGLRPAFWVKLTSE